MPAFDLSLTPNSFLRFFARDESSSSKLFNSSLASALVRSPSTASSKTQRVSSKKDGLFLVALASARLSLLAVVPLPLTLSLPSCLVGEFWCRSEFSCRT